MKNKTAYKNLSLDEIEQRGWIVDDIKVMIESKIWEAIGCRDSKLIAADDGTPYSPAQLQSMVNYAVNAASAHLRLYL